MKLVGLLLITVLFAHAQCGARCLAAGAEEMKSSTSPEPSCHQHAQAPANVPAEPDSSQNHEKDTPCGQAQVIDEYRAGVSKCTLHWTPLEFTTSCSSLQPVGVSMASDIRMSAISRPASPALAPVLRI